MATGVEALLEDYVAAWSSGDVERIASYLTHDCVFENVGGGTVHCGQEELKSFARTTFKAIPDFKIELKSLFIAGDWAGAEWIQSGAHAGDFPGLPATGKKFSVPGASIIQLQEGKIKREAIYFDSLSFLRQLRALPEIASK